MNEQIDEHRLASGDNNVEWIYITASCSLQGEAFIVL